LLAQTAPRSRRRPCSPHRALAPAGALLFALAATACQPIGPHAIQQTADTREVWIYMQGKDAEKSGIYRCYDNAGRPQCVRVEMTAQLIPSPGFCTNHPP
jgi:hypothetical protein